MIYLNLTWKCCMQVKDAEHRLRHKLFHPNAWMKLTDFNLLTSCPKDELHQWFLGLYGKHIIPAMVHVTPRSCNDQISFGMIGVGLLIQSCPMRRWPESLGALPTDFRVWWQSQADTAMMTISPEYAAQLSGGLCRENRKHKVYWGQSSFSNVDTTIRCAGPHCS